MNSSARYIYPFFESIAHIDETWRNLNFHQERVNAVFDKFYSNKKRMDLLEILSNLKIMDDRLLKLKISYNCMTYNILIEKYKQIEYKNFKLLECGSVDYRYKFSDRNWIPVLKGESAEYYAIFVRDRIVLDGEHSNIVFNDGFEWFTPSDYLLCGTMRKSLIKNFSIKEKVISIDNMGEFISFKLINAMNDLNQAINYPISLLNLNKYYEG